MAEQREPLGLAERARLLDGLGQAVIAIDPQRLVTYWNTAAEALFGWSTYEALGRDFRDLAVPDFGRDLSDLIVAALLSGEPAWNGGFTVRRKDGSTFTVLASVVGAFDTDGGLVGLVSVSTNIGQMLRPLLVQMQSVAVVTDCTGQLRFASPAILQFLGCTEADLEARSLLDLVHADDRPAVVASLEAALADPPVLPLAEFRVRGTTGAWTWVEGQALNLMADPSVQGVLWSFRDASDRRAVLERLSAVALHDPLTGLPNRILLTDRLAQATSRREPHGALLFIDLDDFKRVNDELGHNAGDALLKAVAERLRHVVRPEDSCGRWAGDEFVVLNESVRSLSDALAFRDRLGQVIAEPVEIAGQVVQAHASIGIAMLDGVHDADEVINLADEQMYRDKREYQRSHRG